MSQRNIIIISLDEVRPDHLSCYGYKKIYGNKTMNANNGWIISITQQIERLKCQAAPVF